ncbi:MAG TPA: antibiotic biosynthesis monooxygenase [Ktedonobacterales bacterium]|jgi:heme-degrading monooxygenase HmoA|nr:antibiotic biosynthesis monooxygenase [Ktedonobacterales bacterium]
MHARVTTVAIDPARAAEATQIYQNNVIPAIQGLKGFKGAYLLQNPATGQGISITMWDSEADGQAYESNGTYREQVAKLAALFTSAPSLATYEVGAHS